MTHAFLHHVTQQERDRVLGLVEKRLIHYRRAKYGRLPHHVQHNIQRELIEDIAPNTYAPTKLRGKLFMRNEQRPFMSLENIIEEIEPLSDSEAESEANNLLTTLEKPLNIINMPFL